MIRRPAMRALARALFAAASVALLAAGAVSAQTLPQYAADAHLGVTSCAGSTCHGAIEPWPDSTVLQTEFVTWQREDRHAKAYQVLLNDRSKRIAKNLGLEAAHTAALCLDCHTDNVDRKARGKQFQVSDGVGCESCHGGAVRWLGIHISGIGSHADNVTAGMYPTDDPIARAKLCLSCHFGNQQKFVNHRIMGAGHPRMSFELDTFTAIQPAHYRVDGDYRQRKSGANGVQIWAIGQAMALVATLDAMMDPKRGRDGIFPELVLFDCQACHHPMSNVRWQARSSTGLGPGIVRINDANLIMLRVIAGHVDKDLGAALRRHGLALHKASGQGSEAMAEAAKGLRDAAAGLVERFAQHRFSKADMQALLTGVIREGLGGEYVDYAAAEQATMALAAIIAAMRAAGVVDESQYKAMTAALDKCYQATAKDEAYRPETYVAALRALAAVVPKS